MIFQKIADLFFTVITSLLNWVHLEPIDGLYDLYDFINDIVDNGKNIFAFFIPSFCYTVLLPAVFIIIGFKYGYYLIMWIIHKIPTANIH